MEGVKYKWRPLPAVVCSDGSVAVSVLFGVVVIVRVVVVSPDVGISVEASVSVNEASHVDIGVDVLEFRVVVERNRSEGVEVIGVNFLSLAHGVELFLLGGLSRCFVIRHDNEVEESTNGGVEHKVGGVSHSTEAGQRVSSRHILVNLIINFNNK